MSTTRTPAVRRLSAVLALTAMAMALLLFLWILVNASLRNFVIIVVAQSLAVGAVWVGVSRAGWRRGVAIAVIVAATVVTLFALEDGGNVLKLLVLIALFPVAGALARVALKVDQATLVAAELAGTPVTAVSRATVIMNRWSGGGKVDQFDLVNEAEQRGIEAIVLQEGDDIVQLALDAVERGADALGAAGGDGTQALVATVAAEAGLPFVCVPAGTRNHFALDLGLDRDDVVGALDAFGDAVERRIDLARVNGRTFVNNCSMGLYAAIVQSDEYRNAKVETAAAMLPELLGPDADRLDLRFTDGSGRDRTTTHMLLVSNNPYRLDRAGGFGTRAAMDTATLGLVDLQIESRRQFHSFVARQTAGRVRDFDGWSEWATPRFQLDSDALVEIGVDGEALRIDPPLVFESWPGALRVRLPHHAPGHSPAAVAVNLDAATVRAVARVAAGRPAR